MRFDEDAHVVAWARVRDRAWSHFLLLAALELSEHARVKALDAEKRWTDVVARADRIGGADLTLQPQQRRERARMSDALAFLERTTQLLESACRMHALYSS